MLCKAVRIGDANAGVDSGFVGSKTTAVAMKYFKHNSSYKENSRTGHPAKSRQLWKR